MLERISKNTFYLDLPTRLKIYLVISVAYLKPATTNLYKRPIVLVGKVVNNRDNIAARPKVALILPNPITSNRVPNKPT